MPLFARRLPHPGPFADCRRYKPRLREDFRFQCAYCNISEGYRRGSEIFGVDHFRPKATFPELAEVYTNLYYYCCANCNSTKGSRYPDERLLNAGIGYLDPCAADPFDSDFWEESNGLLSGLSPSGRFTIETIDLNRVECQRFRFRRRQLRERILRLRSELATAMDPFETGWRLAADALAAAEANWEECFGVYPQMREDGR